MPISETVTLPAQRASLAASGRLSAVAATRPFDVVLYGAPAADWRFYPQAIALVADIGLLACLIPAHRAARIDPLISLKHE